MYKITNIVNQKVYIGQTNNPILRWSQHKSNAKYNRGNQVITRALTKYGSNVFTFEVIAMCLTQLDADVTEEQLIQQYDSRNTNKGYNISAGGNTTPRTPEMLAKLSDSLRKYYKTHDGWLKGKKLSKEWKENISRVSIGKPGTNNGRKFPKEWKEKISNSLTGKPLSNEHKKKLSESHSGHIAMNRKLTIEIAEQIRMEYNTGLITQKQLGIKYGLAQSTIFNIIKNVTYTK
jgi:group I intron endonuclease